ncbi:trypsin-like peptidase domain-containing protein [Leptolyngbya sp. ST-U4]|uniref:trypsin-like peptidase domain-containing protein n=1 Tax=Leptolyngbya sp. ST-U4 TaxID=2933912 RepID=UPI0032995389
MKTRLAEYIKSEPLAVGTGFLVGKNHILTNHHVLPTASIAGDFIARFKYEIDSQGSELDFVDYKLDPKFYVSNDNDLDYAIIKILPLDKEERRKVRVTFLEAGDNFGWLRLLKEEDEAVAIPPIPCLKRTNFLPAVFREVKKLFEQAMSKMPTSRVISPIIGENAWARSLRSDKAFQEALEPQVKDRLQVQGFMGQAVSIIQHPKGNRKEIVVYGNQVQAIYQNWIQYETDAEPGASGSPIFNSQWQLVGIHHSALIDAEEGQVVGYMGTRVCRIVEDLRKQAEKTSDVELNAKLHDFLDRYVDNPSRGRIFISAGRKRDFGLTNEAQFEADVLFKLGSKIVKQIQLESEQHDYGLEAVHIQQQSAETLSHGNKAIEWLQQYKKDYQPGHVALEILLDAAPQTEVFSDNEQLAQDVRENVRGAKVYYFRNRAERKLNAELVLKEYLRVAELVDKKANGQQSYFPSQGAQPDTAVRRIAFCADVSMPSLVLYAGYVTNEEDRNLFDDQYLDQLAVGIAHGVVIWANSLSPTVV